MQDRQKIFEKTYLPYGIEDYDCQTITIQITDLQIDTSNTCNDLDAIRIQQVNKMVSKAIRSFPIAVHDSLLLAYQDQAYRQGSVVNTKVGLHHILKVQENLERLPNQKGYRYDLKLCTPKTQELFFPLPDFVSYYVKKTQEFSTVRSNQAHAVNISKITNELLGNKEFITRLRQEVMGMEGLLKVLFIPITADKADQQLTFNPAMFKLEYIHRIIIRSLLEEYQERIQQAPGQAFTILCRGYADSASIRGSGIPYTGEAHYDPQWNRPGKPIATPMDFLQSNGDSIGSHIKNNYQLSVARAWEGIKYAYAVYQSGDQAPPANVLQWQYQGMGIAQNGSQAGHSSRRIEFQLIKK
ncbi:MAG: hypothetical protein AAGG75_15265 [Bacteroidota bacterium]